MDTRLFAALVGLIPAGMFGLATQLGGAALPVVASCGVAVVAAGLHVAWRGQV